MKNTTKYTLLLFIVFSIFIACNAADEEIVPKKPNLSVLTDSLPTTKDSTANNDANYILFTDEMDTPSTGYSSVWRAENAYSTFKFDASGSGSLSAHIDFDNQVPNLKGRCEIHKPLLSSYTCPIGDERVVIIKMKYFLPTLTVAGKANVGGCVGQIMAWDFHRIITTATTKPTDVAYNYLISIYMKNGQIYFQPNHEIYDKTTNTYHDFYIPANNQVIYSGVIVGKPVEISITTKFSRTNNGYVIGTAKFDGDTTIYRKEIRDIVTYSTDIPNYDSATRLEWKAGCYTAGNYKSYHSQVNIDWVSSKVER